MADFIAEFTPSYNDLEVVEDKKWIIHVDGLSTQHAGGIGVVLQSPQGDQLTYKVCLQYQTTNNEVEYESFLKGLELAKSIEAKSILILGDSQLVMDQVNAMCEAKEERMKKYLDKKWIIHVDGSSTQHAGGIGVVLQSPDGDRLRHKVRL